jgi:transposase
LSREQLLPEKITIVPAKVGERNAIENYIDDLTAVYLFDRGYCKYKWYDEMTDKGHRFVSRQHPTTVTEEYKSYYTGVDNLYDYDVTMGTEYSRNKTRHKYREILSFTKESDEEFRLVTNIFDLTAEEIVSLYKMRWDIECFFKWVKQHLSIKKWVGYNLNAISIQIYCALIIYLLLLMLKSKCKYNGSLYDLLRKIRVNLLETFAFKTILSG